MPFLNFLLSTFHAFDTCRKTIFTLDAPWVDPTMPYTWVSPFWASSVYVPQMNGFWTIGGKLRMVSLTQSGKVTQRYLNLTTVTSWNKLVLGPE